LLSIGIITDRSYIIFFDANKCIVVNLTKSNSIAIHGNKDLTNGLHKLEVCLANLNRHENKAVKETKLWHKRMGHVNFKSLHQLNTNKVV